MPVNVFLTNQISFVNAHQVILVNDVKIKTFVHLILAIMVGNAQVYLMIIPANVQQALLVRTVLNTIYVAFETLASVVPAQMIILIRSASNVFAHQVIPVNDVKDL